MLVVDLIIALRKVSQNREVYVQDEDFEMGTIHLSPLKGIFATQTSPDYTPILTLVGDPDNRSIID